MPLLPVAADALVAFLALSLAVLVTPGPSLLLIAATSIARGRRAGLLAVVGTEAGLAAIVLLVVAGLGSLLARFAGLLDALRWAGIAWLALAGLRALARTPAAGTSHDRTAGFWGALAVSALNPATTPFLVALLPQFVTGSRPATPQLATYGLAFIALATVVDAGVALAAARLGHRPGAVAGRRRLAGVLLLLVALLLALARGAAPAASPEGPARPAARQPGASGQATRERTSPYIMVRKKSPASRASG